MTTRCCMYWCRMLIIWNRRFRMSENLAFFMHHCLWQFTHVNWKKNIKIWSSFKKNDLFIMNLYNHLDAQVERKEKKDYIFFFQTEINMIRQTKKVSRWIKLMFYSCVEKTKKRFILNLNATAASKINHFFYYYLNIHMNRLDLYSFISNNRSVFISIDIS